MKIIAYVIRAAVEAVLILTYAAFVILCAGIAGIGLVYRWAVHSTETPEERDARERAEWKLKGGWL